MKKQSAISFLQLVTSNKIREAYDKYTGPGFRHHNPHFKGDAQTLMKGMIESDQQFPNKKFEIKHALEDGDLVAVHSHVILQSKKLELAAVHLFRFEDNKIVEFWDVAQQIPEQNPNENGMF